MPPAAVDEAQTGGIWRKNAAKNELPIIRVQKTGSSAEKS